ncbi:MAG TPA: MiaB/RimO family radical SAM methylthiotransferase [Candidatus Aminicenantes bacterium]|nr:MiaB/RimO family radical SAM methylthiotransferase [Candidatus Aminicenantes bacterium]HRY64284.1 MiaB/RimO family radical SAM methylthiotransferase [Candidatus Aminicenantes bacterium]HRZ71197.1 MiaB/RimO family radical SAM methylthiotransferase [Candidatus Aminicenantes bacterium]
MASFAVRNFGCRANQADAFAWAEALGGRGLRLERDWRRSDVVVVHTCTLTGRADRDVRKFIRAVGRGNPTVRIVVTGCYAERAPDELASLPGVAAVLPRAEQGGLVDRVLALRGPEADAGAADRTGTSDALKARAFLKIQDGCDGRCAYCVIPGVRGPSRSVPPDEVGASIEDLDRRGFREIVLAGIHLSSYGADLQPRSSLPALLAGLGERAVRARLRLTSLDPRRTDDAFLDGILAGGRICPHVHLALQHASERVLRDMGRPVAPGFYEALVERLGRLAPDAALGADLMVGFPGETEADFEAMRAFLERSALTYAHIFSYSPRPGTPAAGRAQVPAAAAAARARILRRVAAAKDYRFRGRFAGRRLEGVVIRRGAGGRGAEILTGNSIKVSVPACAAPRRETVWVTVRRVLADRTEGEIEA